jgi:PTH1 family peptidyl-tRNA hydrolase
VLACLSRATITSEMKLLIGLGNPEKKYINNRHNVGYLLVNKMWQRGESSLISKQSNVFMNDSGTAVKKLVDQYSLDLNNLYIAHDDLDIKLGEYKIQFGRGPKDHNGIKDIEEKLGTSEFWRVRIGIDNRRPSSAKATDGKEYVLQDFNAEELKIIEGVMQKIANEEIFKNR